MSEKNVDEQLIAPCGMHCALCSNYLAFKHQIKKKRGKIFHCKGCRPRNKQCAFLKAHCIRLGHNEIEYCFECPEYPCDRLKHIDQRYHRRYGISFTENLEAIKDHGVEEFLRKQQERFACGKCGKLISVHSRKCFVCDRINSWKD